VLNKKSELEEIASTIIEIVALTEDVFLVRKTTGKTKNVYYLSKASTINHVDPFSNSWVSTKDI